MATTVEKIAGRFRTCPATGLEVDKNAEALIKANAFVSVVFLTIGGIIALLLALTRWQAIHLLPPDWFYKLLTAHGLDMLVVWVVFFEMAGLYFGGVLLNARQVTPRLGWGAFWLMLTGALITNVMVLADEATVMFTAYEPLGSETANPLFYLGIILFAVGALIVVGMFFATVIMAKYEKKHEGSLPLVVFGLVAAAIIAVYTLLSGAIAFIPSFLKSMGWLSTYDPAFYRNLFWSFGHPAQQLNLAAMVSIWYALAHITVGAKPVSEKLSRGAFILYLLFINLGSAHHLLVDPGLGFGFKVFNTSYGMYLAVLGSLIHAFSIPAAIETAQRKRGFTHGLFEWFRKLPWKEPGFGALFMSMIIFGWIGGVTGVTLGTEQINMVAHNTLRLPGHFHATVVGGTTLAFMGFTYYVITLIFRREVKLLKWARWQPYVFGIGTSIMAIGMITGGIQGVSRRSADITGSGVVSGTVDLSLAVLGIGAIISVIGGAMFVAIVLSSLIWGRKQEASGLVLIQQMEPVTYAPGDEHIPTRGAFTLVLIFLVFFAAFYLANWWMLGNTWWVS